MPTIRLALDKCYEQFSASIGAQNFIRPKVETNVFVKNTMVDADRHQFVNIQIGSHLRIIVCHFERRKRFGFIHSQKSGLVLLVSLQQFVIHFRFKERVDSRSFSGDAPLCMY